MTSEFNAWLEARTTRQLMEILKLTRKFPYGYDPFNAGRSPCVTVEDVKQILSKREHIPNKVEGKAKRLLKNKSRNRKGRRDR